MSYADYTYYTGTYGGTMGQADFCRLARRAGAYLDRVTQGQITDGTQDGVQDACCAVAEEMYLGEQGGTVASVSNDGYQVDYVAGISRSKTPEQRLYQAAVLWLGGGDLLFRGV